MEDNLKSVSTDLFYKIRSRFSGLKLGTETGEVTINPEEAVFFDFDYMDGENPLGHVSVSLAEPRSMKVYYSTGITEGMDQTQTDKWYQFLKGMRAFAKRRLMNFDTRDISKDNLDKRDFAFLSQYSNNSTVGESIMSEGMYGTTKTSFQKLEDTKLIVKHSKQVDETQPGARARNISGLFIENSQGERFKYPFIHLAGARAMQRHVQEGGLPYDEIGQYIIGLSEQIAQLKSFGNYVNKNDLLNSDTNSIVERSRVALDELRAQIKKLAGRNYYQQFAETFVPNNDEEIPSDVIEDLTSKFTVKKFNEEMKDVFPIIHRLMKEGDDEQEDDVVEAEENKKDHFTQFETWVQQLGEASAIQSADEDEKRQAIDNLNKLIDKHFPAGMDGSNAISSLEGIIDDPMLEREIVRASKEDSDVCVRPLIKKWIEDNAPDVLDQLDFGDMVEEKTEKDDDDLPFEPDDETSDKDEFGNVIKHRARHLAKKGMRKAMDKDTVKEIAEFIYSFYDRETGKFPKGETGVLTMVEKKFGDNAARIAEGLIQRIAEQNAPKADPTLERIKHLARF